MYIFEQSEMFHGAPLDGLNLKKINNTDDIQLNIIEKSLSPSLFFYESYLCGNNASIGSSLVPIHVASANKH